MGIFKVLNIPIYESQVMVSMGQPDKEFKRSAKRHIPNDDFDDPIYHFDEENRNRGRMVQYGNNITFNNHCGAFF